MSSVLEKPEIRRRVLPINVPAYHLMFQQGLVEERAELIRGVVVGKIPKSPLHTYIASAIHRALLLALPDFWVRQEQPLSLVDSEPEPDVSVVVGSRSTFAKAHPTTAQLVVEVAVTSEELDREKAEIYAEAGVGEYWIVLSNERIVEVYTGAKDGHWKKHPPRRAGRGTAADDVPERAARVAGYFSGVGFAKQHAPRTTHGYTAS